MRSTKQRWLMAGLSVSTAAIAAASGASAQREGSALSGQVVDAVSHEVLDSVHVSVKGSSMRANTVNDGSFFLEKLLGNKVVLVLSRNGYKTREVDVQVAKTEAKWTFALWKAR